MDNFRAKRLVSIPALPQRHQGWGLRFWSCFDNNNHDDFSATFNLAGWSKLLFYSKQINLKHRAKIKIATFSKLVY